jgi:hypothetical protein
MKIAAHLGLFEIGDVVKKKKRHVYGRREVKGKMLGMMT